MVSLTANPPASDQRLNVAVRVELLDQANQHVKKECAVSLQGISAVEALSQSLQRQTESISATITHIDASHQQFSSEQERLANGLQAIVGAQNVAAKDLTEAMNAHDGIAKSVGGVVERQKVVEGTLTAAQTAQQLLRNGIDKLTEEQIGLRQRQKETEALQTVSSTTLAVLDTENEKILKNLEDIKRRKEELTENVEGISESHGTMHQAIDGLTGTQTEIATTAEAIALKQTDMETSVKQVEKNQKGIQDRSKQILEDQTRIKSDQVKIKQLDTEIVESNHTNAARIAKAKVKIENGLRARLNQFSHYEWSNLLNTSLSYISRIVSTVWEFIKSRFIPLLGKIKSLVMNKKN